LAFYRNFSELLQFVSGQFNIGINSFFLQQNIHILSAIWILFLIRKNTSHLIFLLNIKTNLVLNWLEVVPVKLGLEAELHLGNPRNLDAVPNLAPVLRRPEALETLQ
jgi:hypothetical protein